MVCSKKNFVHYKNIWVANKYIIQLIVVFVFLFNLQYINAQEPTQFPNATWLQDVHMAGTIHAGVPAPLMPSVQAHLEGLEYMFHVKSDIEKARPLIDALHAQGKEYWVNLDGYILEGNVNDIINDEQGISDPNFGATISLEGNIIYQGTNVIRSVNRPEWRSFLISSIKRAIDAGADGSQHDGGRTVLSESFDDDDVTAFSVYINDNSISTGDWDLSSENFCDYLLSKNKDDNNVFNNDSDPQNVKDLINHWTEFKAVNSLKSWETIRDSSRVYAESKGKSYTIALNAGSALGTHFGHTYLAADYGIGEFFDWGSLFPFTGTLAAKSKAFESIDKRFICWSDPTLDDIPKDPYTRYEQGIERESNMHTIATLYASGGLPQLKYPSSETFPAYLLAQANREILNSVSSAGEIGVVMSHAQTLNDARGFYGLTSVLQDLSRSFKVIWFKSNRLNVVDDLTLDELSKFKVIFLPEVFYLTDNQRSLLLTFISNGGTVLAVRGNVEYTGNYDEIGNTQTNGSWSSLADENNSTVKTHGLGKFINIAHNINEDNGYPPPLYGLAYTNYKASSNSSEEQVANSIRDTINYWVNVALPNKDIISTKNSPTLRVFRYQDTLSHHYVYHLLSDSVQIPSRAAIPVEPLTIDFSVAPTSYNKTMKAVFYTISNPYGIPIDDELTVNQATGKVTVILPEFTRWGFVDLIESGNQSNVKISNLLINDIATPYRLKSSSEIKATWDVENGAVDNYQLEVWTNLQGNGNSVVTNTASQFQSLSKINTNSFKKASKIYTNSFASSSGLHIIPASELHDSTVYLLRLRAIEQSDTTEWMQQFFYRNAPPATPREPRLFTSHQNLWYSWGEESPFAPADTSSTLVYSFQKGADNKGRYGGDYELDTLLYGVQVYTDSITSGKGKTTSELYPIGYQFRKKLGPFEGGDTILDTLQFSLESYENYGIYISLISTDFIDTSKAGDLFGFYFDKKNDPPKPFELISPINNSYTQMQIPFSWKSHGDPDPFNKDNYSISSVELIFDSVATFDSPGLKTYRKDRTGSDFEKDTIDVDLPSNYMQVEGLFNYDRIFWKAIMYDYDRDAAEGGGNGVLGRESSDTFILYTGTVPAAPEVPILEMPISGSISLPINSSLIWKPVAIATQYRIQLSTDSTFQSVVKDEGGLQHSSINLLELSNNTTYFWRVKAKNGGIESEWSSIWKFTTVMALPEKIVLSFPLNDETISTDTVLFSWQKPLTNSDNYWLEYGSDSLFSNSTIDSTITDTTKSVNVVLNNNTYWWKVRGRNAAGWGEFSEVFFFSTLVTSLFNEGMIPVSYNLEQNYPNPFNPSTTINFALPKASQVELTIYNLLGEKIVQVINEFMNAGNYTRNINLSDLSSGIYVYKIYAGEFIQTKKMIMLK